MDKQKRKVIHDEGRDIIASVYYFLKQEYELMYTFNDDNCDLTPLRNITKRTADATGVSTRTVQHILMEKRKQETLAGPDKKKKTKTKKKQSKPKKDKTTTKPQEEMNPKIKSE